MADVPAPMLTHEQDWALAFCVGLTIAVANKLPTVTLPLARGAIRELLPLLSDGEREEIEALMRGNGFHVGGDADPSRN